MMLSASERLTQLNDPALFKTRAYIDGEWSGGAATFAVLDPADNAEIAQVPDFGADEALRAIAAAHAALPAW
ncbi:MAG TPA: succinate-semialdehyde dehydrogenase (NADP(+)), partial [Paraburkholderia sp.]